MLKRIFAEALLVAVGTLFFLALAATVGIPTKDRNPVRAVTTGTEQLGNPWRRSGATTSRTADSTVSTFHARPMATSGPLPSPSGT